MTGLLILGVIVVVFLIYAGDRVVKALIRARRLRVMSERLAAAAARAAQQETQRRAEQRAAAASSAALTSVLPAINRPPLTLPGQAATKEPSED
jgi:hypothetical protein